MKLLQAVIAFYLLSFLVFSVSATFGIQGWDIGYYLCADIGGCGWLVWLLLYNQSGDDVKRIVKPVLIFSVIVFLWDIISYSFQIGVNHPTATGIGFGVAVIILLLYLAKGIKWK